jgi:hypothetical protein
MTSPPEEPQHRRNRQVTTSPIIFIRSRITRPSTPPVAPASSPMVMASISGMARATRSSTACPVCGASTSAMAARNWPTLPTVRCWISLLQHLLQDDDGARHRTRRQDFISPAQALPAHLLHQFRFGRQRYHRALGAPLLEGDGQALSPAHHWPPPWLSRLHLGCCQPRRHGGHA